ncbi:hypothetical protein PC118_g21240, partial [Phytophthora cactorum]
MADSSDLPPYP